MKQKLVALLLALTMISWAQSTTPTQTPAPEQKSAPADAKATCPCCDKMASDDPHDMHKHQHACMRHDTDAKDGKDAMAGCAGKDAKEMAACCGKDGKSCVKDDQTATCCADGKPGHELACCSGKPGRDTAHAGCCGAQCGKHDHHDHATPGT